MRNIDFYLDTAKKKNSITSDNKLGDELGIQSSNISFWRTGRGRPSEFYMIRLADMCGIDREKALIDLNIWRSEGAAQDVYKTMARRIATAVIAVTVCGYAIFSPVNKANATETLPSGVSEPFQPYVDTIYYGKSSKLLKKISGYFKRINNSLNQFFKRFQLLNASA